VVLSFQGQLKLVTMLHVVVIQEPPIIASEYHCVVVSMGHIEHIELSFFSFRKHNKLVPYFVMELIPCETRHALHLIVKETSGDNVKKRNTRLHI
jgi:hypothetical protein